MRTLRFSITCLFPVTAHSVSSAYCASKIVFIGLLYAWSIRCVLVDGGSGSGDFRWYSCDHSLQVGN